MSCKSFIVFSTMVLLSICGSSATTQNGVVCPVNSQILLTGDSTLLNRQTGITSSSASDRNPASNFVISSEGWCSSDDTTNIFGQYIEISFTEPIVPVILVSGGKLSSYVQNFSLLYTEDPASNDLQTYGVLKSVQDFHVPDIFASDAYFALERPVVARRIRFHVNGGISDQFGRICWSMMVYGCRASEAQTVMKEPITTTPEASLPPSTTPSSENSPIMSTADTTTDSFEQPSPVNCPQEGSLARQDLLLVVIPCVVVLIVVVLIAVTAGVIICICLNKSSAAESPTYESVKVKMSNKRTKEIVRSGSNVQGVYDQPRPQFYDVPKSMHSPSPFRSSTSSLGSNMEVKNPVYLEKKNLQEMSMALQQLPSDDGNDYEDVMEALPKRRGQDRHTQANAAYTSSSFYRPPLPITSELPNNDAARPPLEDPNTVSRTRSLENGAVPKYSKVNKDKKGAEGNSERGRSTSPVIKSHYMSTNAAITEELNRLTTELENSLRGQS